MGYGYEIIKVVLPKDGEIEYAKWLHPMADINSGKTSFTQEEVDELRKYIKPGDTVIDVGAFNGDTSLPLALAAGPTGKVLAFEPNPEAFGALAINATLNTNKTNIIAYRYAATLFDGIYDFGYGDPGLCNGSIQNEGSGTPYVTKVEGRNINNILQKELSPNEFNRISYIKIDTEGYDLHVIYSIRDIIQYKHPILSCEFHIDSTQETKHELYNTLINLGYKVYVVDHNSHKVGEELTAKYIERVRHFDVLAIPNEK